MPINLSGLSTATTALTALSNLVVVQPSPTMVYRPQNPPNNTNGVSLTQSPPKFLFHYEGEQSITLDSDITDHYVEDNTAIQDQIALKPIMITTHGFIGELNNVPPFGLDILKEIADKLTALTAYAPAVTSTAQLIYAEAFLIYQVAKNAKNAAVSAISSLTGTEVQNEQQIAYTYFYGYWKDRVLFTVQTPWVVYRDMAIKTLRAVQDAETRMVTDFEITFKKINTAIGISAGSNISFSGRAADSNAPIQDQGTGALNNDGPSFGSSVSDTLAIG